jgi:hypothetical protein
VGGVILISDVFIYAINISLVVVLLVQSWRSGTTIVCDVRRQV